MSSNHSGTPTPTVSLIVVLYNMPLQGWNTLQSLMPGYQRGVSPSQYEVIVVENRSANNLPATLVAQLPPNFRYFLRDETGVSPASAINYALSLCRSKNVGLMIDGAYLLTPCVLHYALQALSLYRSVVSVPGYYLTQMSMKESSDQQALRHEQELLDNIGWQDNGYKLFQEAVFSRGNRYGIFQPFMESNAFFFTRSALDNDAVDEGFSLPGGGSLNLHIFRQLCMKLKDSPVILIGEGCFHQYHGGITTTSDEQRERLVQDFKAQLDTYWPEGFKAITREPVFFGHIPPQAVPLLQQSALRGTRRFDRLKNSNQDPWPDDKVTGTRNGE